MPKKLYEEALADVRQVKEAATADAKRALVEALAPRISALVERQLMGDLDEGSDCDDEEILSDDAPATVAEVSDDQNASDDELPPTKVDSAPMTPANLLSTDPHSDFEAQLEAKEVEANRLASSSKRLREGKVFNGILSQTISKLEDMYGYVQESVSDPERKVTYEGRLEEVFQKLTQVQETVNDMAKKRLNEEDVTLKLTGLPDELDLENIGIDLITDTGEEGDEVSLDGDDLGAGDEGGEELDFDFGGDEGEEPAVESTDLDDSMVVEIDESMLRSEIARIQKSLTESDNAFGHGKEEGDPLDVTIQTEASEDDEAEEVTETADVTELPESKNESFNKLLVQRGSQRVAKLRKKLDEAKQVKNKRLVAVIEKEISRTTSRINEGKANLAKISKDASASKNVVNENRTAQRHTDSAVEKQLRKKLEETNLYTAKLVACNKLLQSDALTSKQKSQVISRLEEAKTPREVKLVYESVTKTFGRRTVAENTSRVDGSSSRVTKPAAKTLNEGNSAAGFEVERWVKLAGIK